MELYPWRNCEKSLVKFFPEELKKIQEKALNKSLKKSLEDIWDNIWKDYWRNPWRNPCKDLANRGIADKIPKGNQDLFWITSGFSVSSVCFLGLLDLFHVFWVYPGYPLKRPWYSSRSILALFRFFYKPLLIILLGSSRFFLIFFSFFCACFHEFSESFPCLFWFLSLFDEFSCIPLDIFRVYSECFSGHFKIFYLSF